MSRSASSCHSGLEIGSDSGAGLHVTEEGGEAVRVLVVDLRRAGRCRLEGLGLRGGREALSVDGTCRRRGHSAERQFGLGRRDGRLGGEDGGGFVAVVSQEGGDLRGVELLRRDIRGCVDRRRGRRRGSAAGRSRQSRRVDRDDARGVADDRAAGRSVVLAGTEAEQRGESVALRLVTRCGRWRVEDGPRRLGLVGLLRLGGRDHPRPHRGGRLLGGGSSAGSSSRDAGTSPVDSSAVGDASNVSANGDPYTGGTNGAGSTASGSAGAGTAGAGAAGSGVAGTPLPARQRVAAGTRREIPRERDRELLRGRLLDVRGRGVGGQQVIESSGLRPDRRRRRSLREGVHRLAAGSAPRSSAGSTVGSAAVGASAGRSTWRPPVSCWSSQSELPNSGSVASSGSGRPSSPAPRPRSSDTTPAPGPSARWRRSTGIPRPR